LPRLAAGDVFAERFEIRRQAGAGGMSLVYAARDRQSGQAVALKLLAGERASTSRFVRETYLLSELHHPAIVRYIAHGDVAGQPWMAMEWLDGEDLSERLSRAPLGTADTLVMAERVAGALGAAHARGVVHRDIKPSNLFLPEGRIDRVKVLDFGVARMGGGEELTQTNTRVGTPAYMSPEQARGKKEVKAASDVFSLGVVMWQCLTGVKPFVGDDAMAVIARILLSDPPRLRELLADCPAALDELVARMLEKDPLDRPLDGAALSSELATVRAAAAPDGAASGPSAIGAGEHRLTCLILARDVGADGQDAVAQVAASFGARCEPMAEGSVAVMLGGGAVATDLATMGARCALAVRAAVPHAPVALATGRAMTGAGATPSGEVIDRAAALLRGPHSDGSGSAGASGSRSDGARSSDDSPAESPWGETQAEAPTVTGLATPIERPGPRASDAASRGDAPVLPVLLDAVTAGLLDARFDVGGIGSALALRGERERDPLDTARPLLGKMTPFVSRDAELAALEGAYAACADDPGARAVLVTAAPGLGKTRLRQELCARLARRDPAPLVLLGRGDPTSAGAPFGVVGALVRREAGLVAGEPARAQRGKLAARIARHLGPDDAARASVFLGEMIGVRYDDADRVELRAARSDPQLMVDQIRRAWEDWLAAEARARPLVVVLEDLHWGDLPSVACVDAALRNLRDLPLLVMASARPDVHERFPGLWSERGLTEIRLGELGKKAAEKIVVAVLGASAAPATVARLVERAGGNALFLEELVRAAAGGHDDASSPTVLAMVQARLEGMEVEARRVLRAASVFGETFTTGGLEAVLGGARGGADAWLDALVEREALVRRGDGRGRDVEHGFRHALVRDAAYAMLPPDDRALGHRLAAQWLEQAGERDAIKLAEHWERGATAARAAPWWRRAAEQALGASDLDAVLAHAKRAVACGAAGPLLGAVRAIAAEAHDWRGEFGDAERAARDAMRWLGRGDELWFTAAGVLATAAGVQGKSDVLDEVALALDEQMRTLDEAPGDAAPPPSPRAHDDREPIAATRLAEQLIIHARLDRADVLLARLATSLDAPSPAVAGRIHAARALRARYGGDAGGNLAEIERAAACFDAAGDRRNACVRRERLGYAHLELGAHELAERTLRDAMATAQQLGLRNVVATARHNLGLVLSRLGRHAEARAMEEEAVIGFRTSRNRRMEGASLEYLALILLDAGQPADAEIAARQALAVASIPPALPLNQAESWSILARALLARGKPEEAVEWATAGADALDRLGGIDDGEAIIRLTHAEALAAAGRADDARAALARARARLLERAARFTDPLLRASFLERVPENARTLALAGG
jgi:tetratricopeptide (TPR) repeat protein/tRNA A-37 threonylcarbamoyl transferase component Bud32